MQLSQSVLAKSHFIPWLLVGGVAVAAAAVLVVWNTSSFSVSTVNPITFNPVPDSAVRVPVTAPAQPAQQPGKDVDLALDYQHTVALYDNGHRIQFDNCAAIPSAMTVKGGTKLMLDNRSPDGAEITVNGVAYELWGYEFKVITASRSSKAYTLQIDCRSGDNILYNSARVLVQP